MTQFYDLRLASIPLGGARLRDWSRVDALLLHRVCRFFESISAQKGVLKFKKLTMPVSEVRFGEHRLNG